MKLLATIFCLMLSVAAWSQQADTSHQATNSRKALIVLDGVPYEGSMGSINPSNIADVTIVKPPGSTALYGERGSNGVVLITTKNGKVSYQSRLCKLSESYLEYLSVNRNDDKDFDYVVNGKSLGKNSMERIQVLNRLSVNAKKVDITINPSYNGSNTQATVTITTKQ